MADRGRNFFFRRISNLGWMGKEKKIIREKRNELNKERRRRRRFTSSREVLKDVDFVGRVGVDVHFVVCRVVDG